MLRDFFKLEKPYTDFDEQRMTELLANSNDLRDVLFRPDTLSLSTTNASNPFVDKTFTNVSFSKTEISGVTFRNCTFIDCLFIGTRFVDCEFHGCSFEGCNPYKVVFKNTYIDPTVFEGMLDPVKYWNIGIHLFQELYENSMGMHQREFARAAEFNRCKWDRYVLNHNYAGLREKTDARYTMRWIANYSSYVFVGYGIRAKFLVTWALISVAVSVGVNYIWWDSLSVVGRGGPTEGKGLIEVLYYTITIPSGIGDLTPTSDMGRLIFLSETLIGVFVVALFVHLMIRRTLR